MASPTQPRMRAACAQAAEHYRREHGASGLKVQVMVDTVPQLAPGVGDDADWYKVGSLLVEPDDHVLYVYLHANSHAVKLEQPLEDVVPDDDGERPS